MPRRLVSRREWRPPPMIRTRELGAVTVAVLGCSGSAAARWVGDGPTVQARTTYGRRLAGVGLGPAPMRGNP
jgi:hypothetical protein